MTGRRTTRRAAGAALRTSTQVTASDDHPFEPDVLLGHVECTKEELVPEDEAVIVEREWFAGYANLDALLRGIGTSPVEARTPEQLCLFSGETFERHGTRSAGR